MLEVKRTVSGLPGIELFHASRETCQAIRAIMQNNWTDSEDFKARKGSGAFLQGYQEEEGWVLIEFWLPDYTAFVNHLNRVLGFQA